MMKTIETYYHYNARRYSTPWVAKVDMETGKIDFSEKIGGYTGGWNTGDGGDLYVINPEKNQVYAYGQKDRRGNNGGYEYAYFDGENFVKIEKEELIATINTLKKQEEQNVISYAEEKENEEELKMTKQIKLVDNYGYNHREYEVESTDIIKLAYEYGHAESDEELLLYIDDVLYSGARWDSCKKEYYEICVEE